jgi:hypothetical protein
MSLPKPTKFQANNSELRQPKMSHIRSIKPEYFVHEGVNEMSIAARLMLPGIWTCCDKHGRFEWKPKTLKLKILPFDDVNFESLMLEAVTGGFITRYEVGGQKYGLCMNWAKHQGIGTREKDSKFEYPAPPPITDPTPPSGNTPAPPIAPAQTLHSADTVQAQGTHSVVSVGVGLGLGVGVGKEMGVCESTHQPNTSAGGSVDAPQNLPSAEPKSKPAGNEKTLWAQLRDAYQEVYDEAERAEAAGASDNPLPEPIWLLKEGLDKLEAHLPELMKAEDVQLCEVIMGWKVFLRDKYVGSLLGPAAGRIKMPIAFFVSDGIPFYIDLAKREALEELERARTVQPLSQKTAAEIASEILENNLA